MVVSGTLDVYLKRLCRGGSYYITNELADYSLSLLALVINDHDFCHYFYVQSFSFTPISSCGIQS